MSEFRDQMKRVVSQAAQEKGYRGAEGRDELPGMDGLSIFVRDYLNGPHQHALGEAVYKIVRYVAKGAPKDLVKAAAWCELVWNTEVLATPPTFPEDQPIGSFPTVREVISKEYNSPAGADFARQTRLVNAPETDKQLYRAVTAVMDEISLAVRQHGEQEEVFSSNPMRALAIVQEELGELAQALLAISRVTGSQPRDKFGVRLWTEPARTELVQVAAMALYWLSFVLEGRAEEQEERE